jgi:hypothetical protein
LETREQVDAIIVKRLETTPPGETHWSTRSMAKTAGVSHTMVGRIWRTFRLQPHRTESFNGKFRDECLSLEWFRTRPEATAVIESWRQHYNDVRPHSSLGQRTPTEFKESMHRRNEESQVVTQGAIFQ